MPCQVHDQSCSPVEEHGSDCHKHMTDSKVVEPLVQAPLIQINECCKGRESNSEQELPASRIPRPCIEMNIQHADDDQDPVYEIKPDHEKIHGDQGQDDKGQQADNVKYGEYLIRFQ